MQEAILAQVWPNRGNVFASDSGEVPFAILLVHLASERLHLPSSSWPSSSSCDLHLVNEDGGGILPHLDLHVTIPREGPLFGTVTLQI